MTAPVPFHQLEPALLAQLADGPRILIDLAEAVGYADPADVELVAAALRSMRKRRLVSSGPGQDGIVRWSWSGAVGGPR